jgi:uncharacterized damage-inducible protein DinB
MDVVAGYEEFIGRPPEPAEPDPAAARAGVLELFHRVARTVPAYADFLARHGADPAAVRTFADFERLPLTTKDDYQRRYQLRELCRDGGGPRVLPARRQTPLHPPVTAPPPSPSKETLVTVERIGPPLIGAERETLRAFLDYHRATLAMKCEGLSDDDLRRRSMPPSTLSLLGLVRHMAEVERTWFRRVINGEDIPLVWSAAGDYQVAYDARTASRSAAFDAWLTEVGHARRIEEKAESLDVIGHQARWGEDVSLRLVMLHMIQEYARHNGHADFLREGVDGTVGA